MLVKELLAAQPSDLPLIDGKKTVVDAMDLMSAAEITAVLIGSPDQPAGIFTSKDLLRCRREFPDLALAQIRVEQVMTEKLIAARPEDTVEQAMAMMIKAKIRHLPVVADQKIKSLLGLEDLVRTHVVALTQELHYLKDYISDLQDAAHD